MTFPVTALGRRDEPAACPARHVHLPYHKSDSHAPESLSAAAPNDKQQEVERLKAQFREALEDTLGAYTDRAITTADMVNRLLDLAKWVREAKGRGEELGLTADEEAFYDALAENRSARVVVKSDALRLMPPNSRTWRRGSRSSTGPSASRCADLRRKVRRLLAKYGYPPDLSEDATQLALKQAELSTGAG